MRARLFVTHTDTARLAPSANDRDYFLDLAEHVAAEAELDHAS